MSNGKKTVVYFTKNGFNNVRVYEENISFNSEDELEEMLRNKNFSESERFFLIFDIK